MLIPVTFTHADSPPPPTPSPSFHSSPAPFLAPPAPAASLSAFFSGSKRARAPNGIQSPSGWLPLAGFKRGGEGRGCPRPRRGRFRLLGITDGDLLRSRSLSGMEGGREENYATTHVNTADEREWKSVYMGSECDTRAIKKKQPVETVLLFKYQKLTFHRVKLLFDILHDKPCS